MMSTELELKINPNSFLADAGGVTLIATPIGAATAGDLPASGSLGSLGNLGSEAAEQNHSPDTGSGPAGSPEHAPDASSSPTPAVLDHAATVAAAPAPDHAAITAPVQEGVPSAAGPALAAVSISDHGIQTGPSAAESHPAVDAGAHPDSAGQSIAHQFDLLIAAGNPVGPTEGL